MAKANGIIGYLAVGPARAGGYLVPLLAGSRHNRNRKYVRNETASNRVGPVNAMRELSMPSVDVLARVHANWFNHANLSSFFARDGDGQPYSIGPVQWRLGGEEPYYYTGAKIDKFLLTWDEVGKAILASFRILPYGGRRHPVPSAYVQSFVGGRNWSGRGVTYGGHSGVTKGALAIDNRLRPDVSSPRDPYSIDGDQYPVDYHGGFYTVGLSIEQYTHGATLDTEFSGDRAYARVRFVAPEGGIPVQANLLVTAPDVVETVDMGAARKVRIYDSIKPSYGGRMFWFSAG